MLNKMSFGEWCKNNNHQDFIDLWDNELNQKSPFEVSITDKQMYYFKCPRNLHDSELHHINKFHTFKTKNINCFCCNSFKQYVIDNYSEDYFNQIWSDKNTENPMKITAKTNSHKVWLKCLNRNDHPDYKMSPMCFSRNHSCPLCVNIKDGNSLGDKYPDSLKFWSNINKKTPFDYSYSSAQKVFWKCNNNIHDDYERRIFSAVNSNFICTDCSRIPNMVGKKFGLLTVIKLDDKNYEDNQNHWICQCECGKYTSFTTALLNFGSVKTCGDKSYHQQGKNAPSWKGGVTPKRILARSNTAYSEWRDAVYKKDWYTCQCCGKSKGIIKNAHHLQNFSDNEELRYEISNGITMCKNCHYTTVQGSFHNIYGTTNNTPEQLEEFINNKRKELGINIPFVLEDYLNGDILKPNVVQTQNK